MSWRESIARWLVGDITPPVDDVGPISNLETPSPGIIRGTSMYELFAGPGYVQGLPVVSENAALTISAVWACVSLIAGSIATLPMQIYDRTDDGELTERPSDDLWWLFNEEFCPRWLAHAGWEWLALSRLFHGDAFAEIKRTGPRPVGLVPLHPRMVETLVTQDGQRLVYVDYTPDYLRGDGKPYRVIDQDDMLHIPGLGFNGTRSLSPLRHALSMAGGVALATQNYAGQFFANQARPDYALVAPKETVWGEEDLDRIRSAIDERHANRNGAASRPMLLSGGLDIKSISLPNEDAELIASRQFQVEEIARVYGVPPFMIGHNEKTTSWGSGVAEMGTGFVRYVLRSHLDAFQAEINRKFFRTARRVAAFDTFELEKADLQTLFETFRAAVGRAGERPIMSVNEVRRLVKLNKVADGDSMDAMKGTSNAQEPAAEPAAR